MYTRTTLIRLVSTQVSKNQSKGVVVFILFLKENKDLVRRSSQVNSLRSLRHHI